MPVLRVNNYLDAYRLRAHVKTSMNWRRAHKKRQSPNMTAAHDPRAIEQTLRVYAEVCKTVSAWLNEAHPEEHVEGEMIQPVFKVR